VSADGTAEGRIVGDVAFMPLRGQRFRATVDDDECDETTARTSHTSVAPYQVAGDYDASLAIGMKVPHCTPIYVSADHYPDYARLWFVDPTTNSWANLVHQPDTRTYPVHQSCPRNLWDEIETAYHWWCAAGRPGPQQWRITIIFPKASSSPSLSPPPRRQEPRPNPAATAQGKRCVSVNAPIGGCKAQPWSGAHGCPAHGRGTHGVGSSWPPGAAGTGSGSSAPIGVSHGQGPIWPW
jgi:hypothetical protein